MKKLKIFESSSNDMMYAMKDIKNFNKGLKDFDTTVDYIIGNLGYKSTPENLKNVGEHIHLSMENDKIPEDSGLLKEIVNILK